jgi:hypothetical protein
MKSGEHRVNVGVRWAEQCEVTSQRTRDVGDGVQTLNPKTLNPKTLQPLTCKPDLEWRCSGHEMCVMEYTP